MEVFPVADNRRSIMTDVWYYKAAVSLEAIGYIHSGQNHFFGKQRSSIVIVPHFFIQF
jgi:hypothetical protein